MEVQQSNQMARRRALLTDGERERIANRDVDGQEETYRYQAISRVRNKIQDELVRDIEILEEAHPTLLRELREAACPGYETTTDGGQVDDLEAENERLRERVRELEESGGVRGIECHEAVLSARTDLEDVLEEMHRDNAQSAFGHAKDALETLNEVDV